MRTLLPSTLLGVVLVSGFTASALLAQDQGQPPAAANTTSAPQTSPAQPHKAPDPQRQTMRIAKKLGLTADQQAKIEPILADRDQQVQNLRANTNLDPKERRAQLHGVVRDSDSKIEALLNDTQKQQYEQLKQDRRAKKQQRQSEAPTNS
jgi:periplasmic protein CpxP/Spy